MHAHAPLDTGCNERHGGSTCRREEPGCRGDFEVTGMLGRCATWGALSKWLGRSPFFIDRWLGTMRSPPSQRCTVTASSCDVQLLPHLPRTASLWLERSSTNHSRHGSQSFFAVGRAVAYLSMWSPPISGQRPRARFCSKMARTDGCARADVW